MTEGLRTIKPGEYLFLQGQEGHELYFLKSGALDVVLAPAHSEVTAEAVTQHGQVIETFDRPGQLVGEISPILNCPRTASIRARAESTVLAADMRPGAFENALRAKPALGIKIAEELARRVNKTNDRLKKQDMRLLRFLEEVRIALSDFGQNFGAEIDTDPAELSGNMFIELSRLATTLNTLPADLPVSLALPYDQAGAFFAYFGGITFQSAGSQAHAASVAEALAKVQGKRFSAGQMLCACGEEAKELFILLQGKLNVVVGRRTIQTVEGRGSMVGEMAFLLKTRRTASVIAVEPSMVLAVPFDKMEPLFARVPQLLVLMLRQLANRLLQIDVLFQKSTWRGAFFGELLPAFAQTVKAAADGLPESVPDAARDSAGKSGALVQEAVNAMTKGGSEDAVAMPFGLDELVSGSKLPPPAGGDDLQENPPGADSHLEHANFVLCLSDQRKVFGPANTPRSQFAAHLGVDEKTLIYGRLIGKVGQTGSYAEVLLDDEGTPDSRRHLTEQISMSIGIPIVLFSKPPSRWMYRYDAGGGTGAISADAIPRADHLLAAIVKIERQSLTPLDRSRARRLYLEAVTSTLESHWAAPGQFTDLTPAETWLVQFGAAGDAASDRLKLDPPPGRTVLSILEFAKRVVIQMAGGELAIMGGAAAAKVKLPEKEKQIADLIEARKKAYTDLQIPYEDAREGPLLTQIEKMVQMQRLKEKGTSGEAMRDIATTEKETEKMMDERNAFVTQKLKGDPGRKALGQIKGIEDQLRTAFKEKQDFVEILQQPAAEAEAQKEKDTAQLTPMNLLNAFRDLLSDFYARFRLSLQAEGQDVAPVFSEGLRIYGGRDLGIALQKIYEKDKALPGSAEFPSILRLPGEGYAIYSHEWNAIVVPVFQTVDPFQMTAHAIGEWRWSRIPDAEQKKFQKAFKGGSSIKLDQLGIYFARDYRMLLDDKDVEEGSAKFIRGVMSTPSAPPPAPAPAGAKAK